MVMKMIRKRRNRPRMQNNQHFLILPPLINIIKPFINATTRGFPEFPTKKYLVLNSSLRFIALSKRRTAIFPTVCSCRRSPSPPTFQTPSMKSPTRKRASARSRASLRVTPNSPLRWTTRAAHSSNTNCESSPI